MDGQGHASGCLNRFLRPAFYVLVAWLLWAGLHCLPHFRYGIGYGLRYYRDETVWLWNEFGAADGRITSHVLDSKEVMKPIEIKRAAKPVAAEEDEGETHD